MLIAQGKRKTYTTWPEGRNSAVNGRTRSALYHTAGLNNADAGRGAREVMLPGPLKLEMWTKPMDLRPVKPSKQARKRKTDLTTSVPGDCATTAPQAPRQHWTHRLTHTGLADFARSGQGSRTASQCLEPHKSS